jgi:hypothetical protein
MYQMKETATAEFYTLYGDDFIEFNTHKMPLKQFFQMASRGDIGAKNILSAVKEKMKKIGYKGDMIQFIRKFFGLNSYKMDVVVKNGEKDSNGKIKGNITFDDYEFNRAFFSKYE